MTIVVNSRSGVSKVVSANAFKNNSGVIARAGNVSATGPIVDVGFTKLAIHGNYGSQITLPMTDAQIANLTSGDLSLVSTTRSHTYKPYSAGTFAFKSKGQYIMIRHSSQISGIANTTLLSGAGDFSNRRRVAKVKVARTSHLYSWSLTNSAGRHSAQLVKTYSNKAYYAANAIGASDGLGPDDAASPTIAIPGEFTIKESAINPTNKDYVARTLA